MTNCRQFQIVVGEKKRGKPSLKKASARARGEAKQRERAKARRVIGKARGIPKHGVRPNKGKRSSSPPGAAFVVDFLCKRFSTWKIVYPGNSSSADYANDYFIHSTWKKLFCPRDWSQFRPCPVANQVPPMGLVFGWE